jgi:hypothetical protein
VLWPTVVHFSSALRRDWTPAQRLAELARWATRLACPQFRQELVRSVLQPALTQLLLDKLHRDGHCRFLADSLRRRGARATAHGAGHPEALLPACAAGQVLHFRAGGNGVAYLMDGFSQPESWGVWTVGPSATLVLPLAAPAGGWLELGVVGLVDPERRPAISWQVAVNGVEVFAGVLNVSGPTTVTVPLPVGDGDLLIDLNVDNPIRPSDLGGSADVRPLGIGLASLRIVGQPGT